MLQLLDLPLIHLQINITYTLRKLLPLHACLSTDLSIIRITIYYSSIYQAKYLSINLYIHRSTHPSVDAHIYPSTELIKDVTIVRMALY